MKSYILKVFVQTRSRYQRRLYEKYSSNWMKNSEISLKCSKIMVIKQNGGKVDAKSYVPRVTFKQNTY